MASRSALVIPLGISAPAATLGVRSLLAFWAGGACASISAPPTGGGVTTSRSSGPGYWDDDGVAARRDDSDLLDIATMVALHLIKTR